MPKIILQHVPKEEEHRTHIQHPNGTEENDPLCTIIPPNPNSLYGGHKLASPFHINMRPAQACERMNFVRNGMNQLTSVGVEISVS